MFSRSCHEPTTKMEFGWLWGFGSQRWGSGTRCFWRTGSLKEDLAFGQLKRFKGRSACGLWPTLCFILYPLAAFPRLHSS